MLLHEQALSRHCHLERSIMDSGPSVVVVASLLGMLYHLKHFLLV